MPKRKKGIKLPCVERCPSGRWRYVKYIHRGKPDEVILRSPCIFESPEEAFGELTAAVKLVHEHGAQAVAEARPIPTLGQLADRWLAQVVPATCKATTAKDYESIVRNHLKPALGGRSVDTITRGDIKGLLLEKIATYAPSTVTHMKNALSGILALAVDDEILLINPALNLGRLWREKPRGKQVKPFSADELRELLAYFRKHQERCYALVSVMALAGLRAGEACGLKWKDLDFEGGEIHVRRSLSRMDLVTPKSGKERRVDMAASLAAILRDHRTLMAKEALARGWGGLPEMVFVNQAGGLMDINHFRSRVWVPAQDQAGLLRRRIHDLRHSFVTNHLMAGADIAWVSKQAGHYSIKFTWDQYFHWLPSEKDKATAEALAQKVVG